MGLIDEKELHAQILINYKEISDLGIEVAIHHDVEYDVWIVRLEHQGQRVYTHLEPEEAQALMGGEACAALQAQINQLAMDAKYKS